MLRAVAFAQRCSKYLKESEVPGEGWELPGVIEPEHQKPPGYNKGKRQICR